MRAADRLHRLVTGRFPSVPVGRARALIGVAAAFKGMQVGPTALALAAPGAFRMPRFDGLPMPGPDAIAGLRGLWLASAVAFAIGWRTRAAGVVLAGLIAGALALDLRLYSNHLYLLLLLVALLTLADAGAAASLDARRRAPAPTVPAWPVFLLKLQLSAVYAFAALSKLNAQYLCGGMMALSLRRAGPLAMPDSWMTPGLLAPMAVASIAAELVVAFALWSDRWRRPALGLGLSMHALMVATVIDPYGIALFALEMTALYLLFPGPDPPAVRRAMPAAP